MTGQPQVQESESADFGMDAEPLLHGLLERRDLRRGVKADVEVALADIRRVRAERDRYRDALERIVRRAEEPCGPHEAPLPYDVAWAEQVAIAREAHPTSHTTGRQGREANAERALNDKRNRLGAVS